MWAQGFGERSDSATFESSTAFPQDFHAAYCGWGIETARLETAGARSWGSRSNLLQRRQKPQERITRLEPSRAPFNRLQSAQCPLLHVDIGLDIAVCGFDAFMSEPQRDHSDVYPG